MKLIAPFLMLLLLGACDSPTGNDAADGTDTPPASEQEAAQNEPKSDDLQMASAEGLSLPEKFSSFLESDLPDLRMVSEREWMDPEALENLNGDSEKKTEYENSVFQTGDFNGDQIDDHAAFLIDSNRNVALYAFHGNELGFDFVMVSDEGILEGCCIGASIYLKEPGTVVNRDADKGDKEVEIENDAIHYTMYDESSTVYYFDGAAYQGVVTSN